MRLAAWVVSAAVTTLVLLRLGRTRATVLRAVGLAWGAQALAVIGAWPARNSFVALVALRR